MCGTWLHHQTRPTTRRRPQRRLFRRTCARLSRESGEKMGGHSKLIERTNCSTSSAHIYELRQHGIDVGLRRGHTEHGVPPSTRDAPWRR